MRVTLAALTAVLSVSLHTATAFAPTPAAGIITSSSPRHRQTDNNIYCPPLQAGPPIISNWRYESSKGVISGVVSNHPTISDGERITTSPIKSDPSGINENVVVQTKSGSKYKLSNVAWGASIPAVVDAQKKAREAAAASKKAQQQQQVSRAPSRQIQPAAAAAVKAKPAEQQQVAPAQLLKLAKSTFSLTGTTVGKNGRYLLAGKPQQSSGRQAKIWEAYESDPNQPGIPLGYDGTNASISKVKRVTIKLSPDIDRMRLENANYDKVQSGLFMGRFVNKIEYTPGVPSSDRNIDGKCTALVIEAGEYDLKALLSARKGMPLRGRALRDAAASAGQCIQAVHSSNLVWTDLKTENFIVIGNNNLNEEVNDVDGKMGLPGVKGIDLESVIPVRNNPIDYTPEAAPPEFARALLAGEAREFVLEYSYDMWSLGMMLYELSTGSPYIKKGSNVAKILCADDFTVDVSNVADAKLRDLIGNCLNLDPRKRPDITGFLLHPYFITTGFGPFSF
jgi:hypothetical protein